MSLEGEYMATVRVSRYTKHCHRCIDEFAFRLNEGNCRIDTIDRIRARCERCIGKAANLRIFDEGMNGDRHILSHWNAPICKTQRKSPDFFSKSRESVDIAISSAL